MIKLMLIVPSMNGGGSEKVMSILANNLDRSKFDITLVLLKKEGKYLNDLKNNINLIFLDSPQIRYSVIKLYQLIKEEQPDIVFSTLGSMNMILAILKPFFKSVKFVARESSIVSIKNKKERYPKLFDFLYKTIYSNFHLIVSQSIYMKKDLIENYSIHKEKIRVINNPVDIDSIVEKSYTKELKEKINLLAVGRLNKVKGYDLLLETISKSNNKYQLTILGEGQEENSLKELVNTLNISDRVFFLGFQANPYTFMKEADLMILSSRYEGFPNVVLEANTCGTPVVAFDCPGGTGEIIENGVNGFLVECGNVDVLAETINKAIIFNFDESTIKNLIKEKYSLKQIMNQYETALINTLDNKD
jgi:glycosyltransferase involved in cell wall biosynthesis